MKNNSNIGLALITGATIGAVVSILFAPARGSDTRRKIAKNADNTVDALLRAGEQLKNSTKEKFYDGKESLESRLSSISSQVDYDSEQYIPLLERKIAELRKKSRKVKAKKAVR